MEIGSNLSESLSGAEADELKELERGIKIEMETTYELKTFLHDTLVKSPNFDDNEAKRYIEECVDSFGSKKSKPVNKNDSNTEISTSNSDDEVDDMNLELSDIITVESDKDDETDEDEIEHEHQDIEDEKQQKIAEEAIKAKSTQRSVAAKTSVTTKTTKGKVDIVEIQTKQPSTKKTTPVVTKPSVAKNATTPNKRKPEEQIITPAKKGKNETEQTNGTKTNVGKQEVGTPNGAMKPKPIPNPATKKPAPEKNAKPVIVAKKQDVVTTTTTTIDNGLKNMKTFKKTKPLVTNQESSTTLTPPAERKEPHVTEDESGSEAGDATTDNDIIQPIESKQFPNGIHEFFQEYYVYNVMCALKPNWKDLMQKKRAKTPDVEKMLQKIEWIEELRALLCGYIGTFMKNHQIEPYQHAFKLLTKTMDAWGFSHTKAGTTSCQINGNIKKKCPCYIITFTFKGGLPPVERIVSTEWVTFFSQWATFVRQTEYLQKIAKNNISKIDPKNQMTVFEQASTLANENSSQYVIDALNSFKAPLIFFYNFLPKIYKDELIKQCDVHWFTPETV